MIDKKVEISRLSNFRPQVENANKHTERGLGALSRAFSEVGYVAPMTAAANGEMLDGSARLETASTQFADEAIVIHHDGKKPIIMVRDDIPDANTPLAKKISYGANRIFELDLSWDPEQLARDMAAGVDFDGLFTEVEQKELLAGLNKNNTPKDNYSRSVKSPIYEPTGDKPSIDLLFDTSKTKALVDEIEGAENITEQEKEFLIAAAQRHIVFNFKHIAEYYAHANKELQLLMENSTLVIIDFNQAIAQGFVKLTEEIAEMVRDEYGDD